MSLITIPVDFDHGRVRARDGEELPEHGTGLLTVLTTDKVTPPPKMSATEFIAKWQGTLTMPTQEERDADPRLDYLLRKHAK